MSTGAQKFAETVLQLYPPFRWEADQEDRWMEIMARETGGFSDAVLDQALSIIIRRKDHRMPTVGECINACVEARRWIEKDRVAGELPEFNPSAGADWTSERIKLAYDLCKGTQTGKEAAKEGWILSLWHFCREKQRLPTTKAEIESCKRAAKDLDEAYAKCVRGEFTDSNGEVRRLPGAKALETLGSSMLAKREKLAAEVLGR